MGGRGSCRAGPLTLGRNLALPLDRCLLRECVSLCGFCMRAGISRSHFDECEPAHAEVCRLKKWDGWSQPCWSLPESSHCVCRLRVRTPHPAQRRRGAPMSDIVKISKFLSLVLRHKPEEIGLVLD